MVPPTSREDQRLAGGPPGAVLPFHVQPGTQPPAGGARAFPRTVIVIPARYESTRFPGKPLADLFGRPMIAHVVERARAVPGVERVVVATDDRRIADAVRAHGGEAVMTRADHPSGTDRLAEVAASLACDLVVNVQGDEPLIAPAMIASAIAACADDPALPMATLRRPITCLEDYVSPHVVKVVVDRQEHALYFSRAPVPFDRGSAAREVPACASKHIGLYVYRRDTLLQLAALPPTALERAEALEQLRALEHGIRIRAVATTEDSVGVDTPEDLERVRASWAAPANDTRHHQTT